jgi:putative DNA primase/helicase
MDDYMELRERLAGAGLAAILYSTYSSTPEDFRFRAVIPLARPIPRERYADAWRRIDAHLFGGRNDPATKDAGRMLYLPAAPDGVAVVAEHVPGLALDWEKLPPAPATRATTNEATSAGRDVGIGRGTMEFLVFGAPIGQQRDAALAATRSLLAAGKTIEEVADKVWQGLRASPVGKPQHPWTYEDALDFARDMAKREPTPLEAWPEVGVGGQAAPNGRADGTTEAPPDAPPPVDPVGRAPVGRPRTETGNAERLVDRYGRDLRFCHPWGAWLRWDGTRWKRDDTGTVRSWAKDVVRAIYGEAAAADDLEARKALADWAKRSETAAARAAMIKLAESEPGIPILPEDMDRDRFLLNVLNGTVDLRTGRLRPHDRADNITKLAPVAFDPEATAPTFLAFLERVLPDPDVRAFVRRAVGYGFTGETFEQCLFFLYGGGANGKSTLISVLQDLLGDYGRQAAPELLVSRGGDRHPTELADLFGARLVSSIEVDEGKRLAETLVKQMTGGDKLKARFMRQDFFEWTPSHKLLLAANHRPEIRGTDWAIWRRIHLVPFAVTIPEAERDSKLGEKLRAELSGILNWALAGCLDWRRDGLGVPQAVRAATEAYRAEQDILAVFLSEKCVLDPQAFVASGALYRTYAAWCEENGVRPLSSTAVGRRLAERGLTTGRDTKGARVWRGIRLRQPDETPPGGGFDTLDTFDTISRMSSEPPFREGDNRENVSNVSNVSNGGDPPSGAPHQRANVANVCRDVWRCPRCRALERAVKEDASWRCLGCGLVEEGER